MDRQLKCLIIDDEKPAHLVIQSHIKNTEKLIFGASAYSAKDALKQLENELFDILFLDIEMPLINGLEFIKLLDKRYAIVLITAYNNFAYEAYQLHVVDYIQKPVSYSRFLQAAEKASLHCANNSINIAVPLSITVKKENSQTLLQLNEITHIESIGNYIKIHFTKNSKPIIIYETLKSIGLRLPEASFKQAHKSYIINIQHVVIVNKIELVTSTGITLPIGRKYELLIAKAMNT